MQDPSPQSDIRTRAPGDLEKRLGRLEQNMDRVRESRRRWRYGFWAITAVALLSVGVAFAAFTIDQDAYDGVQGNTISYDDTKFQVTVDGHLASLGEAAAGDTFGGAVEMVSSVGAARTGAALGDWVYVVDVAELSDGSVPTQTTTAYEAELLMDGASQGSLYFEQGTQETALTESVELRYDIGTSLPASSAYVLRITEVSA